MQDRQRLYEFAPILALFAGDIAAGVGKVGSAIAKKIGTDTKAFDEKLDSFIEDYTLTGMASSLINALVKNGMSEEDAKNTAKELTGADGNDDIKKKGLAVLLAGLKKDPQAVVNALGSSDDGDVPPQVAELIKAAMQLGEGRLNEERIDEFFSLLAPVIGKIGMGLLRRGAVSGGETLAKKLPSLLGNTIGKAQADKAGAVARLATKKGKAAYDAFEKSATLTGNGVGGTVKFAGKLYARDQLGDAIIKKFSGTPQAQKFDSATPKDREHALVYALKKNGVEPETITKTVASLGAEVFGGGPVANFMLTTMINAAMKS